MENFLLSFYDEMRDACLSDPDYMDTWEKEK